MSGNEDLGLLVLSDREKVEGRTEEMEERREEVKEEREDGSSLQVAERSIAGREGTQKRHSNKRTRYSQTALQRPRRMHGYAETTAERSNAEDRSNNAVTAAWQTVHSSSERGVMAVGSGG